MSEPDEPNSPFPSGPRPPAPAPAPAPAAPAVSPYAPPGYVPPASEQPQVAPLAPPAPPPAEAPVYAPAPSAYSPYAAPPPPTEAPPSSPEMYASAGPGVPADMGLSGLGLVMQLAGTIFTAAIGGVGLSMIIAMLQLNAALGNNADSSMTFWMLAMIGTSMWRSIAHRAAGTRLLYDGPKSPLSGVRRYIVVSAIHTGLILIFFVTKAKAPPSMLLTLFLVLGAWPGVLAIMFSLPQFRRFDTALPLPEDKGFEGAAIMMLMLGATGLGIGLVCLYAVFQLPSAVLSHIIGIMMVLIVVMLVIRSALHVMAGYRGVSETHMDRAVESANRYGDFGVITAFIAGGAMLLSVMASGADAGALLVLIGVVWLLLAWPLIIRKFFSERQFADLMSGGGTSMHRRAPDLGHSTLGWFLLGLGVMALSTALPSALFPESGMAALGQGEVGKNPFAMLQMMQASSLTHSPWWGVGTSALQVWAGLELIRMTAHHRLVGSIYGAIATGVAIYLNLPAIEALKSIAAGGAFSPRGGGAAPLMFVGLAIQVVIPVATIILVNRKHPARAR
jgi:hypothetical protein